MLWIETYDSKLINMAHVVLFDCSHEICGVFDSPNRVDQPAGWWLVGEVVNRDVPVLIAHGKDRAACKKMLYRIQTYLGLDTDYNDRHVIRHAWLTHALP